MEVFIASHMKIFPGNKYNSCIHTARNAKVTSTKKKGFQRRIENPLEHLQ